MAATSGNLQPVVCEFQCDHISLSDIIESGANVCDCVWEVESHVVNAVICDWLGSNGVWVVLGKATTGAEAISTFYDQQNVNEL